MSDVSLAVDTSATLQNALPLATNKATTSIAAAAFPVSVQTGSGVYKVPLGQASFRLEADRTGWPDTGADVIAASAEISFDGGQTWELLIGFTARGGDETDQNGMPATASWAEMPMAQPDNPNRLVRTSMQILTPLTTKLSSMVK